MDPDILSYRKPKPIRRTGRAGELDAIYRWVEQGCRCCGIEEVAARIRIEFLPSIFKRGTIVDGEAMSVFSKDGSIKAASITINRSQWNRMSRGERWSLIMHEVCHIFANYYHFPEDAGHNHVWVEMMTRCGENRAALSYSRRIRSSLG